MEQKQVKIIGIKVNQNQGILQSCNIRFDENNNLIAVKGQVGSGKTTFQKSVQLGTLGSDTLKDDKTLYGNIDEVVILKDGEIPVYVGCKSDESGSLTYSIYTKDSEGKKVKEPVIDGVKLTPAKYLTSLQTALTWRMNELTSENATIQKKILLDLYKEDLSKVGVVFDKSSPDYVGSILDKIEKAEERRSHKDFLRKEIGGFAKSILERYGIDVNKPEMIPEPVDVDELRAKENKIKFELDNTSNSFESSKKSKLQELRNNSEEIILALKSFNNDTRSINNEINNAYNAKLKRFTEGHEKINGVCSRVNELQKAGIISDELRSAIVEDLNKHNDLTEPAEPSFYELVEFDKNGICKTLNHSDDDVNDKLQKLKELRESYADESGKTFNGDNTAKEKELEDVRALIKQAEETNKICNAVKAFESWRESHEIVLGLKKEYSRKLKEINTGVDGLTIEMQEVGEKMNVHLMYNGAYNPAYFNNPLMEPRKLSSYSGTQKPMICLLIQNYLLNKKPKALRYLWIDNVPIDNKTKELLNDMGKKLNLTIFINITGDFDKDHLESGEILLEGGEVFFN